MSVPHSTPIYKKNNIAAGLLIDRPDTPQPGDQYLTTDTEQYFVCYETGVWKQLNLYADENGQVMLNGEPLFIKDYATNQTLAKDAATAPYQHPVDFAPMNVKISFSGSTTGSNSPSARCFVKINNGERENLGLLRRGSTLSKEILLMPGDRIILELEPAEGSTGSWTVTRTIAAIDKIARPVYIGAIE